MSASLTAKELRTLWECGRLDLSSAEARAELRRLLIGTVNLRTGAGRLRTATVTLRSASLDGSRLTGTASAYGISYPVGNGVREVIQRGAFGASLAQRSIVPVFYGHGLVAGQPWTHPPIGVATASETAAGLRTSIELFTADSEDARVVAAAANRGALRELSIGFEPTPNGVRVERTRSGDRLERITQAQLIEVSLVVRAANPSAVLDAA